jgi:Transposase IS66 family
LAALLGELYGLSVSEGSLVAAVQRVAGALEPEATAIAEQVRQGGVVGSDETSARVDGVNWWEWVFQTEDAVYHTIQRRRNTDVVLSFLAGVQPGVWVSDLWKPQLAAPAARYQICLAHQLRDLQYAADGQRGFTRAWERGMQALLRAAIHLRHQQDAGTLPVSGAAVAELEATADVVGIAARRLECRSATALPQASGGTVPVSARPGRAADEQHQRAQSAAARGAPQGDGRLPQRGGAAA